jgi:hypothetical protein
MRSLYDEGVSRVELASLFGTGVLQVGKWLKLFKGEKHHLWRGGRTCSPEGYVRVRLSPDDPVFGVMADHAGYVLEHRLVMARYLGRSLRDDETVHHINGRHSDNKLENLQLRIGKHGRNAALRCGDCGSINIVPVPLAEVAPRPPC